MFLLSNFIACYQSDYKIYKVLVSTTGGVFNTINLYLLDSVTGHMVFHCSHKRAKGPVTVVHSENWVVVSTVPNSGIVIISVCIINCFKVLGYFPCSLCIIKH